MRRFSMMVITPTLTVTIQTWVTRQVIILGMARSLTKLELRRSLMG
jgi:hypothetical protein